MGLRWRGFRRRSLPGARRQRDLGVTEQGRDVLRCVVAHQPIGAAILDAHMLQPGEIAQQFLPFRRNAGFTREIVEMLFDIALEAYPV